MNYITLKDGKIYRMTESTGAVELEDNDIAVTDNQLAIIRACDGNLDRARKMIDVIEEMILENNSK